MLIVVRRLVRAIRLALVPSRTPGRTARTHRPVDRLSSPVWISGSAAILRPRWDGRKRIPAIPAIVAAAKKGEAAAKNNKNKSPERRPSKDNSLDALQKRLTALENAGLTQRLTALESTGLTQSKVDDDQLRALIEACIQLQREKVHSLEARFQQERSQIQSLEADLANHVEMRNKIFKGKFTFKAGHHDTWYKTSDQWIIGGRVVAL